MKFFKFFRMISVQKIFALKMRFSSFPKWFLATKSSLQKKKFFNFFRMISVHKIFALKMRFSSFPKWFLATKSSLQKKKFFNFFRMISVHKIFALKKKFFLQSNLPDTADSQGNFAPSFLTALAFFWAWPNTRSLDSIKNRAWSGWKNKTGANCN